MNHNFTLIPQAKLKSRTDSVLRSLGKAQQAVQDIALSAMYHTSGAGAGNVEDITRLVAGMPASVNLTRLAGWLECYFPMTIDRKARTVKLKKMVGRVKRDASHFDFNGAAAVKWWEFNGGGSTPDDSDFDVDALKELLAKVAKGGARGKRPITPDAIAFATACLESTAVAKAAKAAKLEMAAA